MMIHDTYLTIDPAILLVIIALMSVGLIAGFAAQISSSELARKLARWAVGFSLLTTTGLFLTQKWISLHRVLAYSMPIEILIQFFVVSVIFLRTKTILARLGYSFVALLAVPCQILAYTTSSLGPNAAASRWGYFEETENRFFLLHCVALPALLVTFNVVCWYLLRPGTNGEDSSSPTKKELARVDDGNPYLTPEA